MAWLMRSVMTQLVIGVAKPMNSVILPTMAGLAKFWPRPPKSCFTTTIAMKHPTAAIQIGSLTGRLNARISPVTAALRSPMVLSRFIIFLTSHSKNTQKTMQQTAITRDLMPKT